MNKNKKILGPLIEKFEVLRQEPFNRGKRDHDLDDLFAVLFRADLSPGDKKFKDETHKGIRIRQFEYTDNNHKCHVLFLVKTMQGKKGETEFTAKARFKK